MINRKKLFVELLALVCIIAAVPMYVEGREAQKVEYKAYQEIDNMLEEDVANLHIPAMSVIIVDKDQVLFSGNYGSCCSADTPFIIGSVSKSFTALCIMQLVEEGKVILDNPISNYIDVSKYLKRVEDGDNITVKQLLNQTAGLGTYQVLENAEIIGPVGVHQYANVNYGLLGKIIEAVSGESYEEYVTSHVFIPLGMDHSAASLDKGKEYGLIAGYRNFFGLPIPGEPDYPTETSWGTVPAGYLIASSSDMGKYLQMYLNNGSGIISPQSIDTMFYDNVLVDQDKPSYYGMGWGLTEQYDVPVLYHSGLVESYMSDMLLLPENGIGVMCLVNTNDYLVTDEMMNQIRNNIINKLLNGNVEKISSTKYVYAHMILDAGYLLLVLIAFVPLIRLKKWEIKGPLQIIASCIVHFVFPTLLLMIPALTGNPMWTIWLFVKDLFLVLVISAILLYIGGIIKVVKSVRQMRRTVK